jgi:hypothetical protein
MRSSRSICFLSSRDSGCRTRSFSSKRSPRRVSESSTRKCCATGTPKASSAESPNHDEPSVVSRSRGGASRIARAFRARRPVRYPDPRVKVLEPRFARYRIANRPLLRLHTELPGRKAPPGTPSAAISSGASPERRSAPLSRGRWSAISRKPLPESGRLIPLPDTTRFPVLKRLGSVSLFVCYGFALMRLRLHRSGEVVNNERKRHIPRNE